MKRYFLPLAKTSLVLVYLVIVAGALVRMTGSGMGCPDWPKCFGYYIPPTDIQELLWEPDKDFKKGQVIIHEKSLWTAKEDFTTGSVYNDNNWQKYTKHDYAEFNAKHTWTEYINRLCGALAGLACVVMAFTSFGYWRERKSIVFLSWLVVFAMGFQAWLGATVVFSVLSPIKITVHMVTALVIVAMLISLILAAKPKSIEIKKYNSQFRSLVWISIVFTLVQVVLGTQVREFVDEQVNAGIGNEVLWLLNPNWEFYAHRSFSFLVIFLNLYLFYLNQKQHLGFHNMKWVLIVLGVITVSGIAMYYLHFPFGTQTIHLVFASILFGIQYQMTLESRKCYHSTT